MEIKEMMMEDIQERMSAINEELNGECDVDALTVEFEALEQRANDIRANAEKRKALMDKIANGEIGDSVERHDVKENDMEERTFAVDSVEYRDAYLKSLQGKAMSMEERTALTSAASVIPTQTLNKIYGLLEENPLIRELDVMNIPGYVSIPKATAVASASWKDIDAVSVDSADTVGSVPLGIKKLIKTVEITADIKAMAIPAFEAWLTKKLAEKMEAAICAAVINGSASDTTTPTGVLNATGVIASGVTSMTIANIGKMMAKLKAPYHKNAIFVMSADTFFNKVLPLANDRNGVLVNNGIEYRLLGHKVVLDENCDVTESTSTTHNVLFGDFKNYVFNYGEGVSIEADQSVAFRSGSTVYRAMALCDGAVADPDAFVKATA